MSQVVTQLNDSGAALRSFLDQWSRDPVTNTDIRKVELPLENMGKQSLSINESPLEACIDREMLQDYLPVYEGMSCLPLMEEVDEPIFIDTTRNRIQHLLQNVTTWCDFFTSKSLIYFYRRITEARYQSPAHMRIVYAIAIASELATVVSIIIDDELDDVTSRSGVDTWHLRSRVPTGGDCILLNELARAIIRTCVPDSHPAKTGLIQLLDNIIIEIANYFVLPTVMQASKNNGKAQRGFPIPVKLITRETVASRVYVRAGKWFYSLFSLSRLAACYTTLHPTDLATIRDQIFRVADIICIMDDVDDSPNPDKPLESLTKDDLSDISKGDIQNKLLLATIEQARNSSNEKERNNILDVLQSCYGTDNLDDARIVTALYRKYNIVQHVKGTLREEVEVYKCVSQTKAMHSKMPQDMIYFLARFFIIGDGLEEETSNNEKREQVIRLFQHLGQSTLLSPMEKQNTMLELINKV